MAGELHETCGQGIAASFGPAERKLPPDRTALDVDDAKLAAAQLIDDRCHRHDGHGVAVADESLDPLGRAQPHDHVELRNADARASQRRLDDAARYFEITSRVPEPLSRSTRGTVCNSASVTWSQRPYRPFVEAISTSSSGMNGS